MPPHDDAIPARDQSRLALASDARDVRMVGHPLAVLLAPHRRVEVLRMWTRSKHCSRDPHRHGSYRRRDHGLLVSLAGKFQVAIPIYKTEATMHN